MDKSIPAIISTVPVEPTCVITAATLFTWGNLASMSPTLMCMGAPENAPMNEDPGGRTSTSAPIPAVRVRVSCSIPSERPTISRISVTSSATATTLISERSGRCTKFPTIMRFIMSFSGELLAWAARRFRRARSGLIEVHHVSPCWLLQRKLVIGQRFVDFQFNYAQGNVVILPWPFDLDRGRECSPRVVFVFLIVYVGHDVSLLVIDPLPVRQQVGSAEFDPAR